MNEYVFIGLVVLAVLLLFWFIIRSDRSKGGSSRFSDIDFPDFGDGGGGGCDGDGGCD